MTTFMIGLIILIVGGVAYGAVCERIFCPDDRQTPAVALNDGVDYVPMKKWKSSLIELLNIAGTSAILGPIQGILFGPAAFILIPLGCIFGGAMHDYFNGMISVRENGAQMPVMVRKFLGRGVYKVYNVFLCLLMFLVGAVFIYTPGDLVVTQLLGGEAVIGNPALWVVYLAIFAYCLIATLFPIDKFIGKIYPIFGGILLLSAAGVFFGMFESGYQLTNLSLLNWKGIHPDGIPLLPAFFVTIACGMASGFHSTQTSMISRTLRSEREGRTTFFNMTLLEGVISMIWAAAAMGIYDAGAVDAELIGTPSVVGVIANDLLGPVGGLLAVIGLIVLPVTSGDTALRSLRLMLAEYMHFDQRTRRNRIFLTVLIFIPVAGILVLSKASEEGFNLLWQYFSWSNQTLSLFAFSMITVYLMMRGKNYLISLCPGAFYAFVVFSYILSAHIGFNLTYSIAYVLAGILTIGYIIATLSCANRMIRLYRAELVSCS